jgi:hypothetical protein
MTRTNVREKSARCLNCANNNDRYIRPPDIILLLVFNNSLDHFRNENLFPYCYVDLM